MNPQMWRGRETEKSWAGAEAELTRHRYAAHPTTRGIGTCRTRCVEPVCDARARRTRCAWLAWCWVPSSSRDTMAAAHGEAHGVADAARKPNTSRSVRCTHLRYPRAPHSMCTVVARPRGVVGE
ncbi:hypothetical protein AB1Y20_008517 [Prymnesium parvum]|uniref:Uncharacterized protein n=1 Tax=Prymnesium parvum TaxID=97485 RepID=A0AB34IRH1_PRYPA